MTIINHENIVYVYAKMFELNGGEKLDIDNKDYTLRLADAEVRVYQEDDTIKTEVRLFDKGNDVLLMSDLTVDQVLAEVIEL